MQIVEGSKMAIFQGLLFLFFGVGLLLVNYRALTKGWLPCGPNGIKGRLEFKRDASPLMFWLMFTIYTTGGLALIIFAIRLLTGLAVPLPLQ